MTAVALPASALEAAERLRGRAWIVGWWATGRTIVLAAAAAVHFLGPRGYAGHDERLGLVGLLGSWDGRWYRVVAAHGYLLEHGRQSDPAFFPLFPLLLRSVHALGLGYRTAGIVLANLAFLGALLAFEALTRELFGGALARRATVYVAIFPLGFVFSMTYPESLVLLLLSLGALAAVRARWLTAAALLAAAALARPEALFVSLPLLPLAWRERTPMRRGLALGAVLAPAAAVASFALELQLGGQGPLAWMRAQRAWGRHFSMLGLLHAVERLPRAVEGNAWILRDVVFFVVYLALLAAARRAGASWPWVIAGAVVVVLPAFSGSFHSIGRFGLLAPAVFWGLAALGSSRRADAAIRAGSVVLLAAAVFAVPFVFP